MQEAKFLPAFFLPVVERGEEFAPGDLPHHITFFPPIEQPYERSFGDGLRDELNLHYPFSVRTAGLDMFGPNHDILVRLLEPSLAMQGVHYLIQTAIGGLKHDTTYRRPYNPHITISAPEDVPWNDTIVISGLSIVEKVRGANWKVVDKVGLKGVRDEA